MTEAEQLKESKEAFSALKTLFNELLKEHQGLLRHSGSIAVGLVSLKLERLGEDVDKRFAKIGHDPRIAPLIERAGSLETRMESIEDSQKRNRATYKDIRDAQSRLEKAVAAAQPAKPTAHDVDDFYPPESESTEYEQNGP